MSDYMTLSMKIVPKRRVTMFDDCVSLSDIRAKKEMQVLLETEMRKAGGITPEDLRAIDTIMGAVELPAAVVSLISEVRS